MFLENVAEITKLETSNLLKKQAHPSQLRERQADWVEGCVRGRVYPTVGTQKTQKHSSFFRTPSVENATGE
jgi:hypothetical protein